MKTARQIQDKMLDLYESKEKFGKLVTQERKTSEEINVAFSIVEKIYSEKIEMLSWVLDNDNQRD